MKNYPCHSKNVQGPFCVDKDLCLACGGPENEAPELMSHDDNGCYFMRQPETSDQLDQAIRAVAYSCCGSVRYEGSEQKILSKLIDLEDEYEFASIKNDANSTLELCNEYVLIQKICHIPVIYFRSNRSFYDLLKSSGYFNNSDLVTVESITKYLNENKDLVRYWIEYSEEKRTSGGWYIDKGRIFTTVASQETGNKNFLVA